MVSCAGLLTMTMSHNNYSAVIVSLCFSLIFSYGLLDLRVEAAVSCRRPRVPYNGNFTSDSSTNLYPVGTVVKFKCDDGFKLKGSLKIECQEDGQWSEKSPICVRKDGNDECQDAPTVLNGYIIASHNYPKIGSSVTYKCNLSYKLKGNQVRTCQENRKWSGATPHCEVRCSIPPHPAHGSFYIYGTSSDGKTLPYGSIITYYCESCWSIAGKNTRNCMADGTWSGRAPVCVKKGCNKLESVDNGEITYYPNILDFCAPIGSKAIIKCNENYHAFGGSSLRSCSVDGQWSGSGNPVCRVLTCDTPSKIANGKWTRCLTTAPSLTVGSCIEYKCNSGYYLWGSPTRTCSLAANDHPFWDYTPPKCLALTQYSKECEEQGEVLSWDKNDGKPVCSLREKESSSSDPKRAEVGTLTIVTATAGSIFGILVVLVFVVACQRRRNYHYRRIRRQRRSLDDHWNLIAYTGDVHFVLPSYDEAITQEEREPPSFDSAVGNVSATQGENTETSTTDEQTQTGNQNSETVTTDSDLPGTSSHSNENNEGPAERECNLTLNPIYEEIETTSQDDSPSWLLL